MSRSSGSPPSNPSPYERWLGIPPAEQPPNYYRLLGLRTFESDPVLVAEAAATRRLLVEAHLQGPESKQAQRLMAEIAAAERCLLDPHSRAEYDAQLRSQVAGASQPVAPLPHGAGSGRLAKWRAVAPIALVIAAAAVLAAAAAYRLFRQQPGAGSPQVASHDLPDPQAVAASEKAPSAAAENSGQSQPAAASSPTGPQGAEPSATADESPQSNTSGKPPSAGGSSAQGSGNTQQAEEGTSDAGAAGMASVSSSTAQTAAATESPAANGHLRAPSAPAGTSTGQSSDRGAPSAASANNEQQGDSAPSTAAQLAPTESGPTKWPVPSQAELQAAEKTIQSVLRSQFAEATDAAKRLALADRLVELAAETDDDPPACYALCRTACTIALQVGDFGRAFAAIDALEPHFDVDPYTLKADLIDELIKATRKNFPGWSGNLDLIESALLLAYEAALEGKSPQVRRLLDQAKLVARRTKSDAITREVSAYGKRLEGLLQKAAAVQTAEKKLEIDAGDRAACHLVGCWLCFARGRWEEGLPLLARGTDAVLASLALDDARSPTTTDAQLELAERWWQQAARLERFYQPRAYLRANHWYELAAPSLSREQLAVWQPRLARFTQAQIAVKPFQYGVVEAGNVASSARGATVVGSSRATGLIDGVIPAVVGQSGIAQANWPCEWTVVLSQVYRLREIRLKLPEADKSFQHYVLSTSADGVTFVPLADHSKIPSGGWQRFVFLSRPVKAIRLRGLFHSGNATFYATELEAYCPPPLAPPSERSSQEPQEAGPQGNRRRPPRGQGPARPGPPPRRPRRMP